MDDTGLPQISDELPELSELPAQDIPEAVREGTGMSQQTAKRSSWLWGIGGLGLAVLIAVPLALTLRSQPSATSGEVTNSVSRTESTSASPASSPPEVNASTAAESAPLLGHLPYEEAPAAELEPLALDKSIKLRQPAAKKFNQMAAAAAADGIVLVPLSGFRSIAEQESLFFDVKAERGEVAATRAAVSAPPGHSEHHTGYAIDIGDADRPSTDLQVEFENTEAFKWLQKNAAYYSFELSFPKNNQDGVSYEPWHWRFVGDRQSLETFYRARTEGSRAVGEEASAPAPANPNQQPGSSEKSSSEAAKGSTSESTR